MKWTTPEGYTHGGQVNAGDLNDPPGIITVKWPLSDAEITRIRDEFNVVFVRVEKDNPMTTREELAKAFRQQFNQLVEHFGEPISAQRLNWIDAYVAHLEGKTVTIVDDRPVITEPTPVTADALIVTNASDIATNSFDASTPIAEPETDPIEPLTKGKK